jgi:hypothetical protein
LGIAEHGFDLIEFVFDAIFELYRFPVLLFRDAALTPASKGADVDVENRGYFRFRMFLKEET